MKHKEYIGQTKVTKMQETKNGASTAGIINHMLHHHRLELKGHEPARHGTTLSPYAFQGINRKVQSRMSNAATSIGNRSEHAGYRRRVADGSSSRATADPEGWQRLAIVEAGRRHHDTNLLWAAALAIASLPPASQRWLGRQY